MVDPITLRRYLYRALFLFICAVLIFLKLLPLTTEPRSIPGPDLLFCLTAVWIMRRPRWAPVGLIVLVHLLADLLFMRPVGLWPALALLGYEFMRRQAEGSTELSPLAEIALAGIAFTAIVTANALFLTIVGVQHPGVFAAVLHVLVTLLAYPFVMAFCVFVLRVRRRRPSELDGSVVA
ncbi:MAG: rod shape-determining protein MreD [Litoreibacter sp.]|nr:rod shape-determining protein MreD [Litoreibacter sp.]MCY4333376.1 rod shape-determining protein MreD [Litoreibacter sp.]